MAFVKCRTCGKYIDKSEAYAVKHGNRNFYYCCEEHSKSRSPRCVFIDKVNEIIGETTNTAFYREMNDVARVYGFPKMIAYLDENDEYLTKTITEYKKNFHSEYARICYFFAILKNNLKDFSPSENLNKNKVNKDFEEPTDFSDLKKDAVQGFEDLLKDLI